MLFKEFPIPLVHYDDLNQQDRFRENAEGAFKLLAPHDRLLPFQFRSETSSENVSAWTIRSLDGSATRAIAPSVFTKQVIETFSYFIWGGNSPLTLAGGGSLDLPCGYYYNEITLTSGAKVYSEVFFVPFERYSANPVLFPYLLIEYGNAGDIDPVYYASGYVNRLYLDTFITKGTPTLDRESELDGHGNPVTVSQKINISHELVIDIVPDYMVKAVAFMTISGSVLIRTKKGIRLGNIFRSTFDIEEIAGGGVSLVTLKFDQGEYYINTSGVTPGGNGPALPGGTVGGVTQVLTMVYGGNITPASSPPSPLLNPMFWSVTGKGETYPNFGGLTLTGDFGFISWDGSNYSIDSTDLPTIVGPPGAPGSPAPYNNYFVEAFFVDNLIDRNVKYHHFRDPEGRYVVEDGTGKIMMRFGASIPDPPVPVSISMQNAESGQDSNLQVKILKPSGEVIVRTMFYTEGPIPVPGAVVGDTVQAEAFSIIENVSLPHSPAWIPGTTQYLAFSGELTKSTTNNPGSLVTSKILTDATPIIISAYTVAP